MGRGRQKAKQTKVARELKYYTSSIDVTALQQELSGPNSTSTIHPAVDDDDSGEYGDPYAAEDDDEDGDPTGRYASAGS
ncbi:MAG: DUF3073 domain-containing protein [Actinomycetota bacterium]|nr:DUF3073 domain-containing protein [Actinomycetota bacterium]